MGKTIVKDLQYFAQIYYQNPLKAIIEWARENQAEGQLLEIIPKLAATKLNHLSRELDYIKTWSPNIVDMHQVEGIDSETASLFNKLYRCVIVGVEPNDQMIEQLRDRVPKISAPQFFFIPALKWLAEKGIYFKGQKGRTFHDWEGRPSFD